MLTLRNAGALLAGAQTTDDLVAIAHAVGCTGEPAALDQDDRRALGIGAEVLEVRIVAGAGALRALVLSTRSTTSLRDLFTRLAAKLSTRATYGLWILVAAPREGTDVGIACWNGGRRPPRVAALVADRGHIIDSDADTLRALSAARGEDDLTTHAGWLDALGREALSRRFFRQLEGIIDGLAASTAVGRPEARSAIALSYTSRLLFLAFLEAKGWLDGDSAFLTRTFDRAMLTGGGFHQRVLLPLFFGTLNTPVPRRSRVAVSFGRVPFLNGGLFTPTFVEKQHRALRFDDAAYGSLFGDLFAHYRFTAREESATLEEAAIDPEMLGRTFECLMATQARRSTGAFYTPHELVSRVSTFGIHSALTSSLGDHLASRVMEADPLTDDERKRSRTALDALTILDPACGSGAFLVHALDRVAGLRQQLGDARPTEVIRRDALTRTIFGVDVNTTAVWLCELRLWLGVVIESTETDPTRVPPLPNLDRNIRIGDSLAGPAFFDPRAIAGGAELRQLRSRYSRATGPRKQALARALDRAERLLVLRSLETQLQSVSARRRELVAMRRERDLFGARYVTPREQLLHATALKQEAAQLRAARLRVLSGGALPFSFPAQFADIGARGGFSTIVGNPPWVRPHRIAADVRETLRRDFQVARNATWLAGATAAGAGAGFGAQVDLAAMFVERSLRLLSPGGSCSLLLPAKLWRSLAGGGVRRLLATDADVVRVEDYSDAPPSFDASVYPGLLVAKSRAGLPPSDAPRPCVTISVVAGDRPPATWRLPANRMAWDESPGAPWLLLPSEVRHAFELMRNAGGALSESVFGRPHLGVKCGFNDAFVVRRLRERGDEVDIAAADGRLGCVEASAIRPVVRGQDVSEWTRRENDECLIWTHDPAGGALSTLPPRVARWLGHYRRPLAARADLRGTARWWSLFRTEGARADRWRVIWSDIARAPRAAILPAHAPDVPLNTCYVAYCRDEDDAFALTALLNSPLAAAWLDALAEPARGGYRRYMGWTMSLLPIPHEWDRAREPLAALARRATIDASVASPHALVAAALEAFDLTHAEVAPLLAWSHR